MTVISLSIKVLTTLAVALLVPTDCSIIVCRYMGFESGYDKLKWTISGLALIIGNCRFNYCKCDCFKHQKTRRFE